MYYIYCNGPIAQLVERFYGIEEVRSSSLLGSTFILGVDILLYKRLYYINRTCTLHISGGNMQTFFLACLALMGLIFLAPWPQINFSQSPGSQSSLGTGSSQSNYTRLQAKEIRRCNCPVPGAWAFCSGA